MPSLQPETQGSSIAESDAFKLEDIEVLAEKFASDHLDAYLNEIKASRVTPARKEINDALWGTIGISPLEVLLLDSPLIQRLRYIRQLGVVHWVYPGAMHTRFEHSLGVLFQVHHLISALNTIAESIPNAPLIDKNKAQLLRICGLLHDVGHPAFSHVSETAVSGLPSVTPIAAEFSKKARVEKRQISEIFAYYVVRSRSMRKFLEYALEKCGNPIELDRDQQRNISKVIESISDAIIGVKFDDRLPLLHELISGPFDADKLDYYVRDARLAGTPSLLDISRLVQKLAVRGFSSEELPEDIARRVNASNDKHYIFGIKWSGVALLDELQLARVLLYAKIYRHPKVVAIEQMLRAAILTIGQIANVVNIASVLYCYPDDVLLSMTTETLAAALNIEPSTLDQNGQRKLLEATKILKAIRERRLWVRGFGLLQRYPADPLEREDNQKLGLIYFREDIEHPQNREKFRTTLLREVDAILRIIDEPQGEVTKDQLESRIMIHVQQQIPGSSQISRAYVIPPNGQPLPYREYIVNRAAWSDSYLSDQAAGFIFCPHEIASAVFLAVEKILRLEYGVKLPESAVEVSKRDKAHLAELKKTLHRHGYYNDAPYDLRPLPDRLTKADIPRVTKSFTELLLRYLQPTPSEIEEAQCKSAYIRTVDWLRQFDDDRHIECAIHLLSRFRMLNRNDTVNAIKKFIEQNSCFRGARVIPFGSAKDSSAISAYFAADLQGQYILESTTLSEAAKLPSDTPIIFVDDFVGSGGQGADILGRGFGIEGLQKDLGEQRSFFGNAEIELLKRVKVGFVFTAAWDKGIKEVESAAKKLGINATVFRYIDETGIPFAFDGSEPNELAEAMASFKARCAEIGRCLVAFKDDGAAQTKKKIAERELGYGNRAMLLGSPFNVPSQTLTAIWASGQVEGTSWVPLMVRRKKH